MTLEAAIDNADFYAESLDNVAKILVEADLVMYASVKYDEWEYDYPTWLNIRVSIFERDQLLETVKLTKESDLLRFISKQELGRIQEEAKSRCLTQMESDL